MKEPLRKIPSNIKRRLPSIELRHAAAFHDDSAHLWAVSYADFLMVLLCFFIIFFSTDATQKTNILQQIFLKTDQAAVESPSGSGGSAGGLHRGTASAQDFPQSNIAAKLQEFTVSKSANSDGLLVQFQDDLYDKGTFKVTGLREKVLIAFLNKVLPYKDQISMTFIGHADTSKVVFSEQKIYRDNFDLSAIRATAALQFAVKAGFPEDQVTAKGNSKNTRVSRTLSVLIRARGDLL